MLKELTAHDVHALLDYVLVECAVTGNSQGKIFTVPYKNVIKPDPKFAHTELKVEIRCYWNAQHPDDDTTAGSGKAVKFSAPKTRH